jgi:predicted PurR-regulated permease PerM
MENTVSSNKLSGYLLTIVLTGTILYVGSSLFTPMCFGLLIALVVYPVCAKLEMRGLSKALAITISLTTVVFLFLLLLALLGWQLSLFTRDLPEIIRKLTPLIIDARNWLERKFSFTISMQDEWLHNTAVNSSGSLRQLIQTSLSGLSATLFMVFIIPIFSALFLYHRRTFVYSLQLIFGDKYKKRLSNILQETVHTYFNYIKGMIWVYIIVGILNSIGLLMLGIKYAILFGMLTAIMTIIPYVGILVSALLPISIAFITKDSLLYPLGVVAVFSFVQYLEANVIFPRIVGSQLKVSTWATLVGILAGGIIWGVAGMVLFIPFVAIFKIVTDNVDEWKALNVLLSRNEHE